MKNIAIIKEKDFMRQIVDACINHVINNYNCSPEVIEWDKSFRKEIKDLSHYDVVINLSNHLINSKYYIANNIIQIPFLINLNNNISRELYHSIIYNESCFRLTFTNKFTGKQGIEIYASENFIFKHSYKKSFRLILSRVVPDLFVALDKYFNQTSIGTAWTDEHPKTIPLLNYDITLKIRSIFHKIKKLTTSEYWQIGVCNYSINEILNQKALLMNTTLIPNKNKKDFMADPFCFTSQNISYIVYERYLSSSKKGILEVMDASSRAIVQRIEHQHHMSYPYIFQQSDDIYMIPETCQSNKISIYKWNPINTSFEFVKDLIENYAGVDTSMVFHNNKYYIFSNNASNKLADVELNIFYSDTLLGPYTKHSLNPIYRSIVQSRNGGSIISNNGVLYRFSQNSGLSYGGSLNICEITELTPTTYSEKIIETITPFDLNINCHGIHTISSDGINTYIDVKKSKLKIFEF